MKMSFWNEKEAKKLFQKLPFYNTPTEKLYIKRLNNINLLDDLPFYNELGIAKTSNAIKGYTRSYRIEIIDSIVELTASKSSIKNFLKDLLDKIKGFKHQITVKVVLKRHE